MSPARYVLEAGPGSSIALQSTRTMSHLHPCVVGFNKIARRKRRQLAKITCRRFPNSSGLDASHILQQQSANDHVYDLEVLPSLGPDRGNQGDRLFKLGLLKENKVIVPSQSSAPVFWQRTASNNPDQACAVVFCRMQLCTGVARAGGRQRVTIPLAEAQRCGREGEGTCWWGGGCEHGHAARLSPLPFHTDGQAAWRRPRDFPRNVQTYSPTSPATTLEVAYDKHMSS